MTEKRSLSRSICADLVRLEWREPSGRGLRKLLHCEAVLEDISPNGACLQVETPVPENIEAVVRHGHHWSADCRIKYCSFREIGYFVGLEFADPDAWRKHDFRPQHLLDLCDLVLEAD